MRLVIWDAIAPIMASPVWLILHCFPIGCSLQGNCCFILRRNSLNAIISSNENIFCVNAPFWATKASDADIYFDVHLNKSLIWDDIWHIVVPLKWIGDISYRDRHLPWSSMSTGIPQDVSTRSTVKRIRTRIASIIGEFAWNGALQVDCHIYGSYCVTPF